MATAPAVTPEPKGGLSPAALVAMARRRRTLALLPFLFVLTAAVSLAVFLPSLWTARATILVNRQQIPEAYVKSTVGGDLEARLLTLSQEILSSPKLAEIVEAHGLYPRLRRTGGMEAAVDRMRRDIRLEAADDDRDHRRARDARMVAFDVTYTAGDPSVAAAVTNQVAALYTEVNSRQREQQAADATAFLESQLGELRARLQAQERRITEYKERHNGELPEQREVNLRTLERLQQQLQLAHEANRRANERRQLITKSLAELDQTAEGAAAAAGGPNVTPAEKLAARLALLRQELAEMQTRYSDRYPDVIQMREQIRALEARLAAETQKPKPAAARRDPALRPIPQSPYVQSLLQQLDQATVEAKTSAEEIAGHNRQLGVYQRRLENTPRREQELALITRDYETTRELFRSLLAKRGEADIAANLEQVQKGEHFRIIAPAGPPEEPAGPSRLRLLLVGLVLALAASGAAVVLAEQLDSSFRRVEELRASIPIPLLSAIPRIVTEADRLRGAQRRRLAAAAVAVGLLLVAGSTFMVARDNQSLVTMLMAEPGAPRR
jgi:polysaccharide chain length determinant protein (PEP-CTERM system associated)